MVEPYYRRNKKGVIRKAEGMFLEGSFLHCQRWTIKIGLITSWNVQFETTPFQYSLLFIRLVNCIVILFGVHFEVKGFDLRETLHIGCRQDICVLAAVIRTGDENVDILIVSERYDMRKEQDCMEDNATHIAINGQRYWAGQERTRPL